MPFVFFVWGERVQEDFWLLAPLGVRELAPWTDTTLGHCFTVGSFSLATSGRKKLHTKGMKDLCFSKSAEGVTTSRGPMRD